METTSKRRKRTKSIDTKWAKSLKGPSMKVPDNWWPGLYNGQILHDGKIDSFDSVTQKWNILLDSNASAEQLYFATRQSTNLERIVKSLQKVLQGGDDAAVAAENFGLNVDGFGVVLQGMLEGDSMTGITRVSNAEARQALDEIANLYTVVKQNVDYVIRLKYFAKEVQVMNYVLVPH